MTGGKPVSKKVISQSLGHVLGLVVAYVIARTGFHATMTDSGLIAAGVSVVAGGMAGFVAREEGLGG